MDTPMVKVIIATHKKYQMPNDSMYIPLHVGASGKESIGYQRDDEGENISDMNPSFCELTGLYWAWKNINADYIGLAHYRRHFSMHKRDSLWDSVLTYDDLKSHLERISVITPNKRRYYIETLYSHYEHTHYVSQLDETRKIIDKQCPEYLDSFDKIVRRRWGYMFNMMIMERGMLNDYCSWLFPILFELKERVGKDAEGLSAFQGRFYGRVSEIIFNVWLDEKIKSGQLKESECMEIPLVHMEKINWWKKGGAFLKAKFKGEKYSGSF